MLITRRNSRPSFASGLPFGITLSLLIATPLFFSQAVGQTFAAAVDCEIAAISHRFEPAHHQYIMSGECYSSDEGKWGLKIEAEWFGKDKRVHERILIGKYGGELWATCRADPVIDSSDCSNVSYNGIYDQRLDDYTSVAPILQSRAHVSDQQKFQIRAALANAFPSPSVEHPLGSYIYSDQFRKAAGQFEIPVYVTLPYSADVVVTVNKLVIDKNGFTVPEQALRQHESANDLASEEMGDGRIFAYRNSVLLPGGKYRLYAWAQAGTHWQSDSRYVDFFVADSAAMQEGIKSADPKVATKSDLTLSRKIKKQASQRVDVAGTADKSELRKLAPTAETVNTSPGAGFDFSVQSPAEGVRYKLPPRLVVTASKRSDIAYRINECDIGGGSPCNQSESTISGSEMSCDEADQKCRYDAPLDWNFAPDKAYMLIVNLTPYQGYDAILLNFEVGHISEEIGRTMVPSQVGVAGEKRPIEYDESSIKRQRAFARPEITSPTAGHSFTAPARFRVRAEVVADQPVIYGVRKAGEAQNVKTTGVPIIQDLGPGEYCVYVQYTPNGPESTCVPFSVELSRGLLRKRQLKIGD